MNALKLLKDDHRTVEGLFKKFEQAGERAHKTKRGIVDKIIEELSIHAAVEEQALYPAARKAVPDTEDDVLEALEEHHIVKWVLSELDGMDPEAERFEAKVTVLIENVRHHVEEEEGDLFPKLQKAMDKKTLDDLGEAIEKAKKVAPTRPHPRSPDTPPGNIIAGTAAGALDRAREKGKEVTEAATRTVRSATKRASRKK